MSSAPSNVAIILHGPPAVGKSQIWQAISHLRSDAALLSLDAGWNDGEWRFVRGPGRYVDLAQAQSQILVIELAGGEPRGWAFPGATRAADEWIGVLRAAGRLLFPFLLWAQPVEMWRRLQDRVQRERLPMETAIYQMGINALYELQDTRFTFPAIPDFSETRIDTTGRQYVGVAREILQSCGL